jgi:hypothetical protein
MGDRRACGGDAAAAAGEEDRVNGIGLEAGIGNAPARDLKQAIGLCVDRDALNRGS